MKLHRPDGPPLSPKAHQIADLLREAEDGLTLAELETAIGSRYLKRVVEGMQRGPYTIGEEDGKLILVAEPHDVERTAGNSPGASGQTTSSDVGEQRPATSPSGVGSRKAPVLSGDAGLITRASADGSLNADVEGQLFPMPSTSHWAADREDRAA